MNWNYRYGTMFVYLITCNFAKWRLRVFTHVTNIRYTKCTKKILCNVALIYSKTLDMFRPYRHFQEFYSETIQNVFDNFCLVKI